MCVYKKFLLLTTAKFIWFKNKCRPGKLKRLLQKNLNYFRLFTSSVHFEKKKKKLPQHDWPIMTNLTTVEKLRSRNFPFSPGASSKGILQWTNRRDSAEVIPLYSCPGDFNHLSNTVGSRSHCIPSWQTALGEIKVSGMPDKIENVWNGTSEISSHTDVTGYYDSEWAVRKGWKIVNNH